MYQEPKINETSTLVSQPSHTGVWIALGVGGALLLIGIIVGTTLLALHFAPSQQAATTKGGSNSVTQHQQSSYDEDELRADARSVISALAAYHAEYGSWPTDADDARQKLSAYSTISIDENVLNRLTDDLTDQHHPTRLTVRACKDSGGIATGVTVSIWSNRLNKVSHLSAGDNCPAA